MSTKRKKYAPKNTFVETPCIIGIDQSYSRTGITIAVNGKVKKCFSIDFKYVKTKTEKRFLLQSKLKKIIESCLKHYKPEEITIIAERIRTYTAGEDLRPSVMKPFAAMMAYIVDTGYMYGIKTYSVDTRAWKNRVLGSSKPIFEPLEGVKDPQKFGSVRKAIELGLKEEISIYSDRAGGFSSYNDDMADSICIALYGFSGQPYLLLLEN